jgi:glyoxylase-like metal-dependent hydrolase (beta-lactamase superfamily II)
MWGIRPAPSPEPGRLLEDNDQVLFGNTVLHVLFVPGHCPGHIAFLCKPDRIIVSGDVLFQGSIGRTDLPGGNMEELLQSIENRLLTLEDDIRVYSGHGPATTIGDERSGNPFLVR